MENGFLIYFVFLLGLFLCLCLAVMCALICTNWIKLRLCKEQHNVDRFACGSRVGKGTPTSASWAVLSWANGGRGSLAVCQRRKPNMSRALCVVFVCRCWVVCSVSYKVSKFLMPMAKPQNSARQPKSSSPLAPTPLSLSKQLLLLPHAIQQKVSATFRQHMQIFTRTWELTFHLFLFLFSK